MGLQLRSRWRRQDQLAPALAAPEHSTGNGAKLEVYVVFTNTRATLAALKTASELANQLHARIHLLVPHVVPYPRPLDSPAVSVGFTERRFRTLVGGQLQHTVGNVEMDVRVQLCRDSKQHLLQALQPKYLAVIGGSNRWFGKDRRLAETLKSHGVHVVFVGI